MSTRGSLGFRINGQDKVMYNHCDSYPSGLGQAVLDFIRSTDHATIKETAERIILVSEQDTPSEEQIMECAQYLDLTVGEQSANDWYCLLREAQGNLEAYVEGCPYMLDAQSFLLDSLYCEYAYIINLDTGNLEYYYGFNKFRLNNKGRYANKVSNTAVSGCGTYYGVALLGAYSLQEIKELSEEQVEDLVNSMDNQGNKFYEAQERKIKRVKKQAEELGLLVTSQQVS